MSNNFPPRMAVVAAALVQRGDEICFVRYAYGDWQGQWVFPAGYVDQGEQPDDAAVREAREEACIECKITGLATITTMHYRNEPMLYLVFLADYVSGKLKPDGREIDKAAFFSREAFLESGLPFEAQNRWLAERIWSGEQAIWQPLPSQHWHSTYLMTYA